MIKVYNDTTIYIMCPPNQATGGPELLHQLGAALQSRGIDAKMYYYPPQKEVDPIHPNYKKYRVDFVIKLHDKRNNILIVPESLVSVANSMELESIRKVIWWLSVDFFFPTAFSTAIKSPFKSFIPVLNKFGFVKNMLIKRQVAKERYSHHLAQSLYAQDFLKKQGLESIYLSDYLREDFLQNSKDVDEDKKEDIIAYNPKKGYRFTKKIIARSPHFKWEPIINMTPAEVLGLLRRAKVYVDFGQHPGKDRIPREAAMMGCCVITGRRGAAEYDDVEILDRYKIGDRASNIDNIISEITACFGDFERKNRDFDAYRDKIRQEQNHFIEDVNRVFVDI